MRRTDDLGDHVGAASAGLLEYRRGKPVVANDLGSEGLGRLRGRVGAHDPEHSRSVRASDLNGRRAETPAGAVHEQRLPGTERGLGGERVMRRDEGRRHRRRLTVAERVRDPRKQPLPGDDAVGEPAAADEAEDPVAGLPRRHPLAGRLDDPCHLHPGDPGRTPREMRVAAVPMVDVARAETGVGDADDHLFRSGLRIPAILDPDDFVTAGAGEDNSPNAATVSSRMRLTRDYRSGRLPENDRARRGRLAAVTATSYPTLFSPLEVGTVTLRNRIVQTGHATGYADRHVPGERLRAYYRERARGGVAMIVSEVSAVHPTGEQPNNVMRLYDDRIVDAYRAMMPELHELGCSFVGQLWHPASNVDWLTNEREVWAPSAVAGMVHHELAHEVSTAEIAELVAAYAHSAANAVAGGADGVEIHGAHGYLPHQFMSGFFNKRTDDYGGSLENRTRFLFEVLRAVRDATGPEPIVGIRLSGDEASPDGIDIEQTVEVARLLVGTGLVSYLSVSFGNYGNMQLQIGPMGTPLGHLVHLAGAVREVAGGVPVIAVGRLTSPSLAEQVLVERQADLIGMARELMVEPEFGVKASQGREAELRPCVGANLCHSRVQWGRSLACVFNPTTGRELELGAATLEHADERRRVLVVGGGPAGMEAARVAALRGHDVTLLERDAELGGQVRLAARLPSRDEFGRLTAWLERELDRLGVTVETSTDASGGTIADRGPDKVVVATGSAARANGFVAARAERPAIPGIDTIRTATGRDVAGGLADLGRRVIVFDTECHVQGMAVAVRLLDLGAEVELVTQQQFAGARIGGSTWNQLMIDVMQRGGVLTSNTVVDRVDGKTVWLADLYGGRQLEREDVDALVVVGDNAADDALARELRGGGREVITVGDCVAPRLLEMAILEGHRAGRAL